jgi:hypothetical protein
MTPFLGIGCWTVAFGVFALLNYLEQAAETIHVFDVAKSDSWTWRARFIFAPPMFVYLAAGFSLATFWLVADDLAMREVGAKLLWGLLLFLALIAIAVVTLAKKGLKAAQAEAGAAVAEQLETDVKVQSLLLVAIMLVCFPPILCMLAVESARHATGTVFLLGFVPLFSLLLGLTAKKRNKKAMLDMEEQEMPDGPSHTKIHAVSKTTIGETAAAAEEAIKLSVGPKIDIPVRQAGVSLAFLQQFYCNNNIRYAHCTYTTTLTVYTLCLPHTIPTIHHTLYSPYTI